MSQYEDCHIQLTSSDPEQVQKEIRQKGFLFHQLFKYFIKAKKVWGTMQQSIAFHCLVEHRTTPIHSL
jgi:hypothetical protein